MKSQKRLDDFFEKRKKLEGSYVHLYASCEVSACSGIGSRAASRKSYVSCDLSDIISFTTSASRESNISEEKMCTWRLDTKGYGAVSNNKMLAPQKLVSPNILVMETHGKRGLLRNESSTNTSNIGGITLGIANLIPFHKQENQDDMSYSDVFRKNRSHTLSSIREDISSYETRESSNAIITIYHEDHQLELHRAASDCSDIEVVSVYSSFTNRKDDSYESSMDNRMECDGDDSCDSMKIVVPSQDTGVVSSIQEEVSGDAKIVIVPESALAFCMDQQSDTSRKSSDDDETRNDDISQRCVNRMDVDSRTDEISDLSIASGMSSLPHVMYTKFNDPTYWREADASMFKVRGETYLTDSTKVSSGPNLFQLLSVEVLEVSKPLFQGHCSLLPEYVPKWNANENGITPEFIFCVNFVYPGPPHYHLVIHFSVSDTSVFGVDNLNDLQNIPTNMEPHCSLLKKFFFGDSDEFRQKSFKMIPRVTAGNFFLKAAIGSSPMIVGKNLNQKFIRRDNYLEAVVDVSSSTMTSKFLKIAKSYGGLISLELAFVLEGKEQSHLPERIIGSVALTSEHFTEDVRYLDVME